MEWVLARCIGGFIKHDNEPTISQQEMIAHYLLAGVALIFWLLALAAIALCALLVGAWERLFKLEEI